MKISLIIVLLIALISCDQENKSNSETKVETPILQTEAPTPIVEEKGFDFTYPDLQGEEVKLSDYRGKWVVVNFWATWCPPCRKEIPDFVKFKSLYGDKIEILGINNEDSEIEKIQDFVFEYEINYPILRANVYNPIDFSRENTMGLPTTVIFNPKGIEVAKRVGPMHFDDLLEIVDLK